MRLRPLHFPPVAPWQDSAQPGQWPATTAPREVGVSRCAASPAAPMVSVQRWLRPPAPGARRPMAMRSEPVRVRYVPHTHSHQCALRALTARSAGEIPSAL